MSNKDLEKAQAILKQFEERDQQESAPVQEKTVEVVESVNLQPEATPIVEQVVEEIEQIPQQVVSQAVDGQIEALTAKLERVTNAYKSLQGKYNKELPDARNDVTRLLAENNLLKQQQANGQAPQVGTPQVTAVGLKERLGQDKVDELGENYVDAIDEATQYQISQALAKQEAEFKQKQDDLQDQLIRDKFARYEEGVINKVGNFMSLVDPFGDGKLDYEFDQFLKSRHMSESFDSADSNMNANVVVDICNMYNNSKAPTAPVAQVAPVAPVHNPKTQAIAPQTTKSTTPQLQPSKPAFDFAVSDYIRNANALASGKMKPARWLAFEEQYNQAVTKGKVNLTA